MLLDELAKTVKTIDQRATLRAKNTRGTWSFLTCVNGWVHIGSGSTQSEAATSLLRTLKARYAC